jgi:hypothetical protein
MKSSNSSMQHSNNSMQQLKLAVKNARMFFSSCLSMHIVPVLFAVTFIVVAQRSGDRSTPIVNKTVDKKSLVSNAPLLNMLPLNAANASQLIAVYSVASVAYKIIH